MELESTEKFVNACNGIGGTIEDVIKLSDGEEAFCRIGKTKMRYRGYSSPSYDEPDSLHIDMPNIHLSFLAPYVVYSDENLIAFLAFDEDLEIKVHRTGDISIHNFKA